LVLTADETVCRWARRPIDLGGGNRFCPLVVGPTGVPVITDPAQARQDPELSVLSAMAHGQGPDVALTLEIAVAALSASVGLDSRRSVLYADLVQASLSEAARKALEAMDPSKYEFQSEFAKRYLAEGRQEGRVEGRQEGRVEGRQEGRVEGRQEGRAELVLKLLALRFGALPERAVEQVRAASLEELDGFAERVLTANALEDVLA
jgi:predicted transposase YdaD